MKSLSSVLIALSVFLAGSAIAFGEATILFTNDIHAHLDAAEGLAFRYSNLAGLRAEHARRGESVFLVDAGDFLQGTAYAALDEGRGVVRLMNAAGCDVATIGNHEFDFGMAALRARLAEARFRGVSCNLHRTNDMACCDGPICEPFAVVTNRGVSVAFVGVTTPSAVQAVRPSVFADAIGRRHYAFWGERGVDELAASVQQAVDAARLTRPDHVVLVSHLGESNELAPFRSIDLIARTSGYEAVIDGHSHTVCNRRVRNREGREVLLVQTGCDFERIGFLRLNAGEEARAEILEASANDVRDEKVARLEEELMAEASARLGRTIAVAPVDLPAKDANAQWLVRRGDTGLGDLLADAFYWRANEMGESVDVAIVNGGALRAGFRAGPVSLLALLEICPFGNEVVVLEMKGADLKAMLAWGARQYPEGVSSSLLQVAGLRYAVSAGRVEAEVYDRAKGMWRELEMERTYAVAGEEFIMLEGGDGFAKPRERAAKRRLGRDVSIFADYLKAFDRVEDLPRIATEASPLWSGAYREVMRYESPRGGGRIR